MSDTRPSNRCCYTPSNMDYKMLEEFGEIIGPGECSCWRPVWKEYDKCIWHADVNEKPLEELLNSRLNIPERLDYAILEGIDADEQLSFSGCVLRNANLRDADLRHVNFTRSCLSMAEFHNSDISHADFHYADAGSIKCFNATIISANFRGADINYGNFSKTNLARTDLTNASIHNAQFKEAYLRGANFSGTNLQDTNFTDTRANGARLSNSNLEEANFVRTDLRNVDMTSAKLFNAYFSDIRINTDTKFGYKSPYDNMETLEDWNSTPTEASVWVYRRLQSLHETHAITDQARKYHIKKANSLYRLHKERNNRVRQVVYGFNGFVSDHGENPWKVIKVSSSVILIWSILYYTFGRIHTVRVPEDAQIVGLGAIPSFSVPSILTELFTSFYFSVITFTTLGHADVQPANEATQILTMVESFIGVLLMALLVFVLGRQTRW